jgi:hypothetical protein
VQPCPRSPIGEARLRGESEDTPFQDAFSGADSHWRKDDNSCSYCGSLNNDYLMERLEKGDVEAGPTDKSYKLYVRNKGGEPFRQSYRNCPSDARCKGPDDCDHWVTRNVEEHKFYFQHLTPEQMRRFVELANAGQIAMGYPGYFYTLPFFIRRG